ncbi:MAG: gliding motility protein GldN [Prevotellaceae bacterium]|jgi:gliding motility associated protien GldN|nr:gliding motility protein GldN [Prevotellaceae bacterium]
MKRTITLFTFVVVAVTMYAQTLETGKHSLVLDGITKAEVIKEKEAIPYPSIREDDVFWSRRVWRVVDLRERLNYPLYYPTQVMQSRKSFVQTLVTAVENGSLKAYGTEDDEFTSELSIDDVRKRFDAEGRKVTRQKLDGSGDTSYYVAGEFSWGDVQELLVKEVWYFDKHLSQMFVRIIGICPIRVYTEDLNVADDDETISEQLKKQLFWIYYPDARKILANTPCYIGDNEISHYSFDDLFLQRRFSSYITAISNNQDYRKVSSYTRNAKEAMLESERLKEEIFTFESELWEY